MCPPHHFGLSAARDRLDAEQWTSDFKVLPEVVNPGASISTRATYVIEDGRPGAEPA